jgi:hypothetical protein
MVLAPSLTVEFSLIPIQKGSSGVDTPTPYAFSRHRWEEREVGWEG